MCLIIFHVCKAHLEMVKVTVVHNMLMKLWSCNMDLIGDFKTFINCKWHQNVFNAFWHWCRSSATRCPNGIYWIAECLRSGGKISVKNISGILQSVYQEQDFQRHQNVLKNWFVYLEVLIAANNSFQRWNTVSPSAETEFQTRICTILFVLQHQGCYRILQLLCNRKSNFLITLTIYYEQWK